MPGPFALLRNPQFFRLWLAGGLAGTMRWLELLAIGIWVFELTRSALMVALLMVLRQIPMLLFGPLAGGLAEKVSRRKLVIVSLSIQAASAAVLALLTGADRIAPWQVGIGAFFSGLYLAIDMPARRTMLGEVAGHDRLANAMGLDAATIHFTRMIGPLLGGVAYAYLGLGGAFAVAALTYAFAAALIVPLPEFPGRSAGVGFWRGIGEGLQYLRVHPTVVAVLLVTVANNFFGFPYVSLIPVLGRTELMIGAVLIGLLGSADGTGAFIGSLTVAATAPKRGWHRIYVLGALSFFVAMFIAAQAPWFALAYGALILSGFGISAFGTMQSTIMLAGTPPALRTRIMGVLTMSIGTGPLGILHAGFLAEHFAASTAMTIMAVEGALAVGLTFLCFSGFRRRVLFG